MGTKNPKISGYVPQEVFDRFQEFQEERGFSMSKAVTAILCDYFDIKETTSSLPSGITLAQFQALEKRLAELEEKVEHQPIYQNATLVSSPESKRLEADYGMPQLPFPEGEPLDSTSKPRANEAAVSQEALFVSAEDLALRFACHPQSIKNYKNKNSTERFIEWTTKRDPDNIAWNYKMQAIGKSMGFFPCKDLTESQRQSFLQWKKELEQ